jgi:phosphatidylserine decarboxylase
VSGFSGKYFSQGDAYYTVNPIAIQENVDVYSLNKRTSVIVESPNFGKVMIICVGATMVGSVVLTSGEDVFVNKGQELGYFQFGGSTLLVLFQRGRIRFDDDLLFNSAKQQETLVKMGTSLGRANRPASTSSYSA